MDIIQYGNFEADNNLDEWKQITHFGVPDEPEGSRNTMRDLLAMAGHCKECTALSGCYFKTINCPIIPQHNFCDCNALESFRPIITAYCDIRKFTDYIFSDKYGANGKKVMFEAWGLTIDDSYNLKKEFEKQAKEKYSKGLYDLGRLDKYFQRIEIVIELSVDGRQIEFTSGWTVHPRGVIVCSTPYGGR